MSTSKKIGLDIAYLQVKISQLISKLKETPIPGVLKNNLVSCLSVLNQTSTASDEKIAFIKFMRDSGELSEDYQKLIKPLIIDLLDKYDELIAMKNSQIRLKIVQLKLEISESNLRLVELLSILEKTVDEYTMVHQFVFKPP